MSNARNLADLLDSTGDVKSDALDNATFDDNKIVNDISTLALRQASDNNKAAYSTNSSSVDVFQDSTGITNLTNTTRQDLEYVNTSVVGSSATYESTALNSSYITGIGTTGLIEGQLVDGNTGQWGMYINSPANYTAGLIYDTVSDTNFGSSFTVESVSFFNYNTIARFKNFKIQLYYNGQWNSHDITASFGSSTNINDSKILIAGNANQWVTGIIDNPVKGAKWRLVFDDWYANGNDNAAMSQIKFTGYGEDINPTGSFEGTTVTAASSVSSMGAIITYQDNAGTNALNTDIVLQLSADNGSNWSTATLTAMPDFSSGIKMAKVNDLAVTSGTSLKYKISFANQSQGSKEARIRGVALQY